MGGAGGAALLAEPSEEENNSDSESHGVSRTTCCIGCSYMFPWFLYVPLVVLTCSLGCSYMFPLFLFHVPLVVLTCSLGCSYMFSLFLLHVPLVVVVPITVLNACSMAVLACSPGSLLCFAVGIHIIIRNFNQNLLGCFIFSALVVILKHKLQSLIESNYYNSCTAERNSDMWGRYYRAKAFSTTGLCVRLLTSHMESNFSILCFLNN